MRIEQIFSKAKGSVPSGGQGKLSAAELARILDSFVKQLPPATAEEWVALENHAAKLGIRSQEEQRKIQFAGSPEVPGISGYDGEPLRRIILDKNAPWRSLDAPEIEIPGMLLPEERHYYGYITKFYSGKGEVLELGPWLGCSTTYLMQSLMKNPHFAGKKMVVVDDFVWRSAWMDRRYDEPDRPENHGSFQAIFERFTKPYADRLDVERRQIVVHDGNEAVEPFTWNRGKIEIAFIDCGRNFAVNDSWYKVLAKSFISGRTLLVLQDWQTHKEIPLKWYNNMKQFTDGKARLELVHELAEGGIATFLFV